MIVLTPNPCFDEIILVPALQAGNVHRALKNETSAGGKGINVVRAVSSLGGKPTLILMLPKIQSDLYKSLLVSENITANFLEIEGQVRKAIIINQESSPEITVINGKGPKIEAKAWDDYCALAAANTKPEDLVLLMGSMPTGIPENGIDLLATAIKNVGGQILVDTSPASFSASSKVVLDFITPNLEEAEALITGNSGNLFIVDDTNVPERAMIAAAKLQGKVAANVFITAGKHGCAFNNGTQSWFLPGYKIEDSQYKSAVGAGDSFVAGLATYLESKGDTIDWKDCASFAMATATASCETFLAGGVDVNRVNEIFNSRSH